MKAYNSPTVQVEKCQLSYMLMLNVSGGGLNGIHNGTIGEPIVIH